jgi:hypothetical protein
MIFRFFLFIYNLNYQIKAIDHKYSHCNLIIFVFSVLKQSLQPFVFFNEVINCFDLIVWWIKIKKMKAHGLSCFQLESIYYYILKVFLKKFNFLILNYFFYVFRLFRFVDIKNKKNTILIYFFKKNILKNNYIKHLNSRILLTN